MNFIILRTCIISSDVYTAASWARIYNSICDRICEKWSSTHIHFYELYLSDQERYKPEISSIY